MTSAEYMGSPSPASARPSWRLARTGHGWVAFDETRAVRWEGSSLAQLERMLRAMDPVPVCSLIAAETAEWARRG